MIGDTVNLASRLESVNKVYGTSIILSEETYRLAQQVIEARELDLITVAGKTEPVRIYEAMGRAGELGPEQSELRELFADGLAAYRRQDWDEAQTHFESCLRIARRTDPRASFSNVSRYCAALRRRLIGAGFGTSRRNDGRNATTDPSRAIASKQRAALELPQAAQCLLWVKSGNAHNEPMMSAFHPIATEQRTQFYVGFVPLGDIMNSWK